MAPYGADWIPSGRRGSPARAAIVLGASGSPYPVAGAKIRAAPRGLAFLPYYGARDSPSNPPPPAPSRFRNASTSGETFITPLVR